MLARHHRRSSQRAAISGFLQNLVISASFRTMLETPFHHPHTFAIWSCYSARAIYSLDLGQSASGARLIKPYKEKSNFTFSVLHVDPE
jgi:hypothetical protein